MPAGKTPLYRGMPVQCASTAYGHGDAPCGCGQGGAARGNEGKILRAILMKSVLLSSQNHDHDVANNIDALMLQPQ